MSTPKRQNPGPRRRATRLVSVAVAILSIALSAPSVLAGQPDRTWLALPDAVSLAAGAACDFPVRIDVLVKGEYNTAFAERDGETVVLTTGRLVVALVNESTGQAVVVNISGPARTVIHEDGSSTVTFLGNGLPFVDGELYVSSGPVVQEVAWDGTVLSTSEPIGHRRDMCIELAA